MLKRLIKDESGASLIEYVMIAGLLSVLSAAALGLANTNVQAIWTTINTALAG